MAQPELKARIIASAAEAAFGRPCVNNVFRSVLAEAIVETALSDGWTWCSADWGWMGF